MSNEEGVREVDFHPRNVYGWLAVANDTIRTYSYKGGLHQTVSMDRRSLVFLLFRSSRGGAISRLYFRNDSCSLSKGGFNFESALDFKFAAAVY